MLGPVRLLILQSTPFCNIDCTYCYLPHRQNAERLKLSVVEAVAERLRSEGLVKEYIEVCWHAGEPLVVPIPTYRAYMQALNERLGPVAKVRYSLQTNATLLSREWCDFIRENDIRVGVSVDGPRAIHDRYRVDRLGRGTFDRTVRGIELLKALEIPYYVIAVLHRESLRAPDEMFEFFQSLGAKEVCFNIEEIEGVNKTSSLSSEAKGSATEFFLRYFELIRATPGSHWLREFSHSLRRLSAKSVHNAQAHPFEILTVDYTGNYSTFSPEMHGMSTERYASFVLGNVLDPASSFAESLGRRVELVEEIERGITRCKETCRYFEVCGGGSPSNKVAENGSLDSAETMNCRLSLQAPVDAMLLIASSQAAGQLVTSSSAAVSFDVETR